MKLDKTLNALMKERNIGFKDLSFHTGIKLSTLRDWSLGTNPRNPEQLQSLADFFRVSIEYLLFGERNSRAQGIILRNADGQLREIIIDKNDQIVVRCI